MEIQNERDHLVEYIKYVEEIIDVKSDEAREIWRRKKEWNMVEAKHIWRDVERCEEEVFFELQVRRIKVETEENGFVEFAELEKTTSEKFALFAYKKLQCKNVEELESLVFLFKVMNCIYDKLVKCLRKNKA